MHHVSQPDNYLAWRLYDLTDFLKNNIAHKREVHKTA
jgi:hypothetical protein